MHNEKLNENVPNVLSENVFDEFEKGNGEVVNGETQEELKESIVSSGQDFVQPVLPDGSLSSNTNVEPARGVNIEMDMGDIYGTVSRACEIYKDNPFLLNNEINRMSKEINSRNG